ncbi:MAG: metallophosphoesterase [Candidatus Altiarchaeota archaeon]|nr:metallophosphoesterase [Candidatus Altiarchaeota archaeon]
MDELEIIPGARIIGLTLFLVKEKTLVFADTHLGYEEYLNSQGIMVPRFQYKEITKHLKEILEQTKPKTIVINGDLKHEFGKISGQEWTEAMKFLDYLKDYEVILVKGNHDNTIGPLAGKKNIRIADEYKTGEYLITHGHTTPAKEKLKGIKTIIIGHEHPAIGLSEEGRTEKVKCFMAGRWQGKNLLVMPSLNFVTEGTDITQEKTLSPLLQGDLGDFGITGVEEGRILRFGKLKEIRQ